MRVKITLRCNECKQRNYNTMKNKKNDPDRLEMKKYCRFCRKHGSYRDEVRERVKAMAEVNKKPNIFVRMGTGLSRWFREMKSELKKVVWPSGKQLVNNTVVVLVAVLIVGIIVCLFDLGAGELIGLLRKLF